MSISNEQPGPEQTLEARAEQGDAEAQFNLALGYATGVGAAIDYELALAWYLKAAEQNHVLAQFNLGIMYARGQGISSDKALSNHWFERAARQGDPGAQFTLGENFFRASLTQAAEQAVESRIRAYKWLRLADAQGYRNSSLAWAMVTVEMTREEVADGNRRVTAFENSRAPSPAGQDH